MNKSKFGKTLLASALGVAALTGFTPSAGAATTTATFAVTGGLISILPPAAAVLGAATPGSTSTPTALGPVVVTDLRGALTGGWTATVSSSDFTTAAPVQTLAKANVSYWSGPATAQTQTGTMTPGQAAAENAIALTGTHNAMVATSIAGSGATTWIPTLSVTVPATAAAGAYTGTITHSVA